MAIPVLSSVLSCPVLSCPILSVLLSPALSSSVLSSPVLSCPLLSCSIQYCFTILPLPSTTFFLHYSFDTFLYHSIPFYTIQSLFISLIQLTTLISISNHLNLSTQMFFTAWETKY